MESVIGDEYQVWESNIYPQTEALDGWGLEEAFPGYYDSSSPDGNQSMASKNIVSERNRRKKLNDMLFALRAAVPNISKMDKASIIKDAIVYIQELHDQERKIQAEILELESGKFKKEGVLDLDQDTLMPYLSRSKKKKTEPFYDSGASRSSSPIEVIELRVSYMREKTVVVNLTCSKRTDTMIKLCEVFESLKLNIITANITAFSQRLMKTLFIEADEEEKDVLRVKIETAIAALNEPDSPMST